MKYTAPIWLPGGHAQTIWPAFFVQPSRRNGYVFKREKWDTADGDFVHLDWQHASAPHRPLLVVFHGLEGSSASHYACSFADWARENDVNWVMPHFRGCSGEINLAPRAYHSGDHVEIEALLGKLRVQHQKQGGQTLWAVGFSLGGNALMRWAGEQGKQASRNADAVVSVCAPLDLTASGHALGRGCNKHVYARHFLQTMKTKALAKLAQYPGLFDRKKLLAAQNLYSFDDIFTAPLHGFVDAQDYWRKASAKPGLKNIEIPALVLNAQNDPFVPFASLPNRKDVSHQVTLWQPEQGGHVGFVQGPWPGHLLDLPNATGQWLQTATACLNRN
jgi:uncharacterized protein